MFAPGDSVSVKNFGQGPKWLLRVVVTVSGPGSVEVKLSDGRVVRRHIDHLLGRQASQGSGVRGQMVQRPVFDPVEQYMSLPEQPDGVVPEARAFCGLGGDCDGQGVPSEGSPCADIMGDQLGQSSRVVSSPASKQQPVAQTPLRASTRIKQSPAYLADYATD